MLEIVGEGFEETKRTVDYLRQRVDPAGMRLELEQQLRRRRFEVSRRANGMVWGEFELPSLAGDTLLVAIDALMPARPLDDPAPPASGEPMRSRISGARFSRARSHQSCAVSAPTSTFTSTWTP